MSLIYREAFMNNNGIDIFTDASIVQNYIDIKDGDSIPYYVACSGAILSSRIEDEYKNIIPKIEYEEYNIHHDCTNNAAELLSILLAVRIGHRYIQYMNNKTHINIISDSKISIYGLRDWIFNWIHHIKDGIMYGSSGPVLNQRIIIQIIYEIIQNNDMVRFYHIRGHQNSTNTDKFIQSFSKENGFDIHSIDPRLIDYMIKCNDRVDTMSRNKLTKENILATEPMYLKEALMTKRTSEVHPILNMESLLMYLDINKYKYLIGRN